MTIESLALEICRVKNLDLSNREFFILVEYLSKDTDVRYGDIMKMTSQEVLLILGLDRKSNRSLNM